MENKVEIEDAPDGLTAEDQNNAELAFGAQLVDQIDKLEAEKDALSKQIGELKKELELSVRKVTRFQMRQLIK